MIKFRYYVLFFSLITSNNLFCSRLENDAQVVPTRYNLPEIKLEVVPGETCFLKFIATGRWWRSRSSYEKLEELFVDEDFDRKFKVAANILIALNITDTL